MKAQRIRPRRTAGSIYRMPALLAIISLVGLVAALMVEGPIDLFWTIAVAAPLFAIAIFMTR
jgi:hypothetical protein